MELFILISLFCLGLAAQPFAAKRLSPLVQGTLGSLCAFVAMTIFGLVASGIVALPNGLASGSQARAADPDVPSSGSSIEDPASSTKPIKVESEDQEAGKLEISTNDTVVIPPGRPAWVEAPSVLEGEVHYIPVCSEPYATTTQAQHALDKQLQYAVARYIADQLHSDMAPKVIHFTTAEIKRKFVPTADVYHEKIGVSFGSMHQVHARLQFDEAFNRELHERWEKILAAFRLAETGVLSGGVLLLLATVFGYFRLDNATRGYYTSRLQFMAAAAILAVVAVSAILFKEMDSLFVRWF
jgi:hypothetical protein